MDAELVPGMSTQGVVSHELVCNLDCEVAPDATAHVDPRQFSSLGLRCGSELATFLGEISPLGIGLGADRDVLTGRHRERAGDEASDRGEQDSRPARLGGSYTHDQAAGGDEAVISTKDRGTHPADPPATVQRASHGIPYVFVLKVPL
jgi:hypothetical protein